jgi:hypothetical protein
MTKLIQKRFHELVVQAEAVLSTKQQKYNRHNGDNYEEVDSDALLAWCVKVRSLLISACGNESEHFKTFIQSENYALSNVTSLC